MFLDRYGRPYNPARRIAAIRTPGRCKGREKDLNDLETGITVIMPVVQTSAANRGPRRAEITIGERS
jgi:hypothetical protein